MNSTDYTFSIPITREVLELIRGELKKAGFNLEGDTGEAEYKGITFRYAYSESVDVSELTLTIVGKSFLAKFFSDADIEGKVREFIAGLTQSKGSGEQA